MSLYLDASVLVAVLTQDLLTMRAKTFRTFDAKMTAAPGPVGA